MDMEKEIKSSSVKLIWQPPEIAMLASPAFRLWHARCIAVRLEEHAVSAVRLGPRKSKVYDIRLDIRESAHPVALNIDNV